MTIVDSDTLTCSPNLYSEKGAHKNHLIVVNGASPRSDVYGQIPRNSLTFMSILDQSKNTFFSPGSGLSTERQATEFHDSMAVFCMPNHEMFVDKLVIYG